MAIILSVEFCGELLYLRQCLGRSGPVLIADRLSYGTIEIVSHRAGSGQIGKVTRRSAPAPTHDLENIAADGLWFIGDGLLMDADCERKALSESRILRDKPFGCLHDALFSNDLHLGLSDGFFCGLV